MIVTRKRNVLAAIPAGALCITSVFAQQAPVGETPTPGYNNKIPPQIMTPNTPAGREANWIETVPGKGWFTLLRLYGPLEPWFDKTWRPGEIELVK